MASTHAQIGAVDPYLHARFPRITEVKIKAEGVAPSTEKHVGSLLLLRLSPIRWRRLCGALIPTRRSRWHLGPPRRPKTTA